MVADAAGVDARGSTPGTGDGPSERPARFRLGTWPTPLVAAPRLRDRVGGGTLLVKRDDLAGFAMAGSKTRALEHLVGDALARGFDTIVTGGVATSNFCQGAAVAARAAGLDCHLLLPGAPGAPAANLAIARSCGAEVTWTGGPRERLDDEIDAYASTLTRAGRVALAVPRGGATGVGGLGFVEAADELAQQLSHLGHDEARVVLAVGSGGSVAGLMVGLSRYHLPWTVTGVSVSRPLEGLDGHLAGLVTRCAAQAGVGEVAMDALTLLASRGRPHGPADPAELRCALDALETEGLVLDSGYTARAALVAAGLSRQEGPPVVLWHTGGVVQAVTDVLVGATPPPGMAS